MSKAFFVLAVVAGLAGLGVGLLPVTTEVRFPVELGIDIGGLSIGSDAAQRVNCGSPLAPRELDMSSTASRVADALFRVRASCNEALRPRFETMALLMGGSAALLALSIVGIVLRALGQLLFGRRPTPEVSVGQGPRTRSR